MNEICKFSKRQLLYHLLKACISTVNLFINIIYIGFIDSVYKTEEEIEISFFLDLVNCSKVIFYCFSDQKD